MEVMAVQDLFQDLLPRLLQDLLVVVTEVMAVWDLWLAQDLILSQLQDLLVAAMEIMVGR
jgi:hypothetical protein